MNLPKIGVVIVNYNNYFSTQKTLRSVLSSGRHKEYQLQIFLVNNGCTDLESPYLDKEFPEVITLTSPVNLGFSGGNNLAIKKALTLGCTHILLINNDAIIKSSNFFQNLLSSDFSITAPILEYRLNKVLIRDFGGRVDYLFGRNTHLLSESKADYFSGACLFIKAEVFLKIGLLPTDYFMYYEDAEFCLRAKKSGFTLGIDKRCLVEHIPSSSFKNLESKKIKILAKSHLLFCQRNLPIWSTPFYRVFNLYLHSKRISNFLNWKVSLLGQVLYPLLNSLYCSTKNTPELHVIGDSHVWPYQGTHPFIVHHFGGVTAYNLPKKDSTTASNSNLQAILKDLNPRRDFLIFSFGEIDCRLHIYNQHKLSNGKISINKLISKTVSHYFSVLSEIKSKGYTVCVLSPTPTGSENNIYGKKFFANFKTRAAITKKFHLQLKSRSLKEGFVYLNLYKYVSNPEGGIKNIYQQDSVHLNNLVVPITLQLLERKKLYNKNYE